MYVWMWHKLPGGWPGKLLGSFVLLLGALALLFYVIFPWVEPRLPFNHVTVTPGSGGPATPAPTVSVTPTPGPAPSSSVLPAD